MTLESAAIDNKIGKTMLDAGIFSGWVSDEARALFARQANAPSPPSGLGELRAFYDAYNRDLLDKALARYPVEISEREVRGVKVHEVLPRGGTISRSALLCLHGGGFMWGDGAGALLEAVPLAVTGAMRVIAVDYRLAPEHAYPAAVDDVLAVYTALTERHPASRVGVYGCSAGAVLTTELVARAAKEGIPVPGATGLFHGAGLAFDGDSAVTSKMLDPKLAQQGDAPRLEDFPYFAGADLADPLVLPGNHPRCLAHFPPTLLVTATRDFAASAVSVMHRRLLAAGVDARLVLFDGLWHAHHMDVELPESRETYEIAARFFQEHLG